MNRRGAGPTTLRPVDRHGWLAVRNGRLVNEGINPVILRGMSLFWSQWGAAFYTEDWVERLAVDWRVDVVRVCLGVGQDGYLEHPDREMAKVDRVINAAIAHGLYVIFDWHSHTAQTDAALEVFGRVSQVYGGCPNLLYEPWNEPTSENWSTTIAPHHAAVVEMLRARDIRNVAICGTGHYCRDVATAAEAPLKLADVCYAAHFYASSHRRGLRDHIEAALGRGLAIFVSEFGLSEANGDGCLDIEETNRWLAFLNARGISHCNWALHDKAEASAALQTRKGLFGLGRRTTLSQSGQRMRKYLRDQRSTGS